MPAATAQPLEATANQSPDSPVYQILKPEAVAKLPVLVVKITSLFDGRRTLAEVCSISQISVGKGQAVVRKLTQLGILGTVVPRQSLTNLSGQPGNPARRATQGFSPEEEAFFAKEVEPIDECDEPFETLGDRVSLFISDLMLRLTGSPVY
jgi:hypothetical protein